MLTTFAYSKAPYPVLTKADGKKVTVKPISTEGDKIVFLKKNGKTVKASIHLFSKEEQARLKLWSEAFNKDYQRRVVQKAKTNESLRILFIGNSYSFNVPKAFEKLAKSKGKKLTVVQSTAGGWNLKRHARNAKLHQSIASEKFDIVVLQEQSMIPSFPEGQRAQMMDASAKMLVSMIRDAGAEPVFFQTWGRRDGDQQNKQVYPNDNFEAMQKRLTQGYKNVANAVGGAHIVPVGEIWSAAHKKSKPDWRKLYSKDGSHPSPEGVAFTAAIFFSAIYDEAFTDKQNQLNDLSRPKPLPYPVK